jgi:hypothetical protein
LNVEAFLRFKLKLKIQMGIERVGKGELDFIVELLELYQPWLFLRKK